MDGAGKTQRRLKKPEARSPRVEGPTLGHPPIQMMGSNAFEGIVNVAGTYIRSTGALTPSGVVVSNVMGAALQK